MNTNPLKRANICFDCKNAVPDDCGHGCEWSRKFEPVPGWTAKPVMLRSGRCTPTESWHITACPKFDPDEGYVPPKPPKKKPKNNADYIRAMSNEELADFFCAVCDDEAQKEKITAWLEEEV